MDHLLRKGQYSILFIILLIVGCKKETSTLEIDNYDYNIDLSSWNRWVYEGDSITDITTFKHNYPYQLTLLNVSLKNTDQIDVGLGGDLLLTMLVEYASQVHPHRPLNGQKCIFAIMAGTNDAGSLRTATQIYENLKTEWKMARDDGFTVVAFCITRSTIDVRDNTAAAVNKLIIADPTLYDYLVRTDLVLPNPYDTNMFADGLHPTDLGSKLIAQAVIKALAVKK